MLPADRPLSSRQADRTGWELQAYAHSVAAIAKLDRLGRTVTFGHDMHVHRLGPGGNAALWASGARMDLGGVVAGAAPERPKDRVRRPRSRPIRPAGYLPRRWRESERANRSRGAGAGFRRYSTDYITTEAVANRAGPGNCAVSSSQLGEWHANVARPLGGGDRNGRTFA